MTRLVTALIFCLTLLPTAIAATGASAATSTPKNSWRTIDACMSDVSSCSATTHLIPRLQCVACEGTAATPPPQANRVADLVTQLGQRLCDVLRSLPVVGRNSTCSPPSAEGATVAHR